MDCQEFKKILIIQTAFIGDVILATSVIENLISINPDYRIDFMLRKGNESLLKLHPKISKLYVWDKRKHKTRNLIRLLKEVRKEHYDLVINLQRFASSGIFTVMSGAGIKVGFDKNPFSFLFNYKASHVISSEGKQHEVDRNLSLLTAIGLPVLTRQVKLYCFDYERKAFGINEDQKYFVVAPASVWFTKQFPVDKWTDFINLISDEYLVIFIGASGDYNLSEQIMSGSSHKNYLNLCGTINLLQSMELMKAAERCFVNDSAPLHLASAANAKVTAIFCSTVPEFGFGPISDDFAVIQTDEKLSCRPCGLHGKKNCPETHFKCAYNIKETDLFKTIEN